MISFKNLIFFIFLSNSIFAQDIKVYSSYQIGTSLGENSNSFRFSTGEILEFDRKTKFKITTDLQYEGIFTKNGTAKPVDNKVKSNIEVNKSFFQSRLSLPIGLEIEISKIIIGVSQEIVNLNFRKSLDSSYFNSNIFAQAKPQSVTSIFSKNNSLSSKLYIGYAPSLLLTFMLGINREKNLLILSDNQNLKIGKSSMGQIQPYFTIRFNIEK